MPPLLRLATVPPQLLVDHVQAYADLLALESERLTSQWRTQLLLGSLALCGLVVALVLAGVALMLWAALPPGSLPAPWVLIAVPVVPLLAAVACQFGMRRHAGEVPFGALRQQLHADANMLRDALAA